MPVRHLSAYAAALPHIRAGAALRLSEAVAVAGGRLKDHVRDEILRRWRSDLRQTAARPRTAADLAKAAAGAGIGFRRTVRKAKP